MSGNLENLKRNLVEIITEEEFDNLNLDLHPTVYCGYETSGPFHIGTMTTALKLLNFLNAGFTVKILLADVHTKLNRKGDDEFIKRMVDYWKRCFIALGLKDAEFVIGSNFQFEKDYVEDVLKLSLETTVNRGIRSMQEVGRDLENAKISQIIYPLMQIVDMKYLKVDVAYGGMEQRKIHMLAREILPKIYKNVIFCHSPLIVSLLGPGSKMSSSKPETMIKIDEEPEIIKKKVLYAYCPIEKENNPILQICKFIIFQKNDEFKVKRSEKFGGNLTFTSYEELENAFINKKLHPADLKNAVAESLIEILEPIGKEIAKVGK